MLYYFTTPASYTAGGTIVIDKRKLQLFQKESVLGDVEVDTATAQTEVGVLKSDNKALRLSGSSISPTIRNSSTPPRDRLAVCLPSWEA
jgi:uncharacterized protein involved in exopolysaccharide biosynthesis